MKKQLVGLVSVLFVLFTVFMAGNAFAEHYVSGIEGIKAGTVPPPGTYYKMYNAFYQADDVKAPNGDTIIDNFDATVFANVHRFIWISDDIKLLGGDYGADITIPLLYKDIGFLNQDNFGLGDIIVEPMILSWHKPSYDLSFGLAAFLPTGKYKLNERMASPGMDVFTFMTTFGGTYYFDDAKTWTASILSRYEMHTRESDRDVKPGDDFHFEWGVGKTVADVWDIGLAGYCQWQVNSDSGTDGVTSTGDKDQVYAIGPEVSMFYPPAMMAISFRTLFEFDAKDRPEGTMVSLVFTKIF